MSTGKTVGIILIIVGLIIPALGLIWGLANLGSALETSGFVFALAIVILIGLPFLGVGAYMVVRGRAEEVHMAEVQKQKQILNMVTTRGEISIAETALELERKSYAWLRSTHDYAEGVTAFLEKRPPKYTGRSGRQRVVQWLYQLEGWTAHLAPRCRPTREPMPSVRRPG